MKKSNFAIFGLLLAGSILASSTGAQAYPTGSGLTVTASKYKVTKAGSTIYAQAKNVYPGCSVSFYFQNQDIALVKSTANSDGVTPPTKIVTPSKAGTFHLVAKTSSSCGAPVELESDSANVVVSDSHGLFNFTVANFKPGSSEITSAIRARIKYFALQYAKATQVDIRGYTMGPTVLPHDVRLSLNRARNAFAVLKSWNNKAKLASISNVQDTMHTGASARRVVVTLRW